MRVIRARAMGMCFGVRDALAVTEAVTDPHRVTIHGELVHNPAINEALATRGFQSSSEVGRTVPETPAVMITAHGVSNRERAQLAAAGKQIIDTTCPLVRRAHDTALRLAAAGWHVIVAGKRNHVEVIGLTGDLDNYSIVETPTDAPLIPHPKLAVICQTTLQPSAAEAITAAVRAANPQSEVRLFDTICRPTRDRQHAMQDLLKRCDAIVVVGGPHSNNTRQLARLAESADKPVVHVGGPDELDISWATQYQTVGLTAGTSTPDSIIDAVEEKLLLSSQVKGESAA